MSKVNWRYLNDEGKDRQLDAWADLVKFYMLDVAAQARKQERGIPYHTVENLCENGGFQRPRWSDVRERMIARGMQISYEPFKGYWWGGEDDVKTILQHPMYVITGILKAARKTSIAMAQGGHNPIDVNHWIASTGVSPNVFCKTLATWDGVDALPMQFEQLLLGPGS